MRSTRHEPRVAVNGRYETKKRREDEDGETSLEKTTPRINAKIGEIRAIFATRDRSSRASRRKLKKKASRSGVCFRIASNRIICFDFFLPIKVSYYTKEKLCIITFDIESRLRYIPYIPYIIKHGEINFHKFIMLAIVKMITLICI